MRPLPLIALAATLAAGCGRAKKVSMPDVKPPIAPKISKELPGPAGATPRQDEYYWLRDRESKQTLDYLKAENIYADTMLSPVKKLREELFTEMKGRIKEDDNGVPTKDGAWFYNYRYSKGSEYAIHTRAKTFAEADKGGQIIFDENKMAGDKPYFDMSGYEISDDGRYAAYGTDEVSRRLYHLKVRDLETGQDLQLDIPDTEGGDYAWSADGQHLFYTHKNAETLLGYQIRRHKMGTDPKTDVVVYEEKDNQFYIGVGRARSRKYLEIHSGQNGVASEVLFLDAATPEGKFVSLAGRTKGHEYEAEHAGDRFYIRTNVDGATNFKVVEAPDQLPAPTSTWKDVIPHDKEVYIEGVESFARHLAILSRKEGLLHVGIKDRTSGQQHEIAFGEPTYAASPGSNPEYDTDKLRYGYTSLTTPGSLYEYDMATKAQTLLKQQPVLGGFTKDNYVSERIYAPTQDGKKVPISIVYRKGFTRNGTAPLLQYGYGSYGSSMDAYFSSTRLSLLDRGFVFAIAHIRGGQELGRAWYEEGKLFNKKNTFADFVACTDYLIERKYASKDAVFAMGGSAGGLLMGAVANLAGTKYKGMVAQVPFVDVVTTMQDSTIPLTTNEYEEWGNPAKKEYYDYMLSYSPYDNVEKKAYPNILVTTGLHDSQVQYWEPAKWVARLRARKTDDNIVLLHTDMEAGHGGASGRFKALKDIAMDYAFILMLMGKAD